MWTPPGSKIRHGRHLFRFSICPRPQRDRRELLYWKKTPTGNGLPTVINRDCTVFLISLKTSFSTMFWREDRSEIFYYFFRSCFSSTVESVVRGLWPQPPILNLERPARTGSHWSKVPCSDRFCPTCTILMWTMNRLKYFQRGWDHLFNRHFNDRYLNSIKMNSNHCGSKCCTMGIWIPDCQVFKWSGAVRWHNGPVFECHI